MSAASGMDQVYFFLIRNKMEFFVNLTFIRFTSTGVANTDLFIMVTGRPIVIPGVLAFAAECASDQ